MAESRPKLSLFTVRDCVKNHWNQKAIEVSRPPSPRISTLAWGRLRVEGRGTFKDAKLFPGGARAGDWRETGTRHVPCIQPADVVGPVARGAVEAVLSKGMLERLRVAPETLQWLKDKGIPVQVLRTGRAAALYNARRETVPIGGLFHSTC